MILTFEQPDFMIAGSGTRLGRARSWRKRRVHPFSLKAVARGRPRINPPNGFCQSWAGSSSHIWVIRLPAVSSVQTI